MTTVARLAADLTTNYSSFESGFRRADKIMDNSRRKWKQSLDSSTKNFSTFDTRVQSSVAGLVNFRNIAIAAASSLSVSKIVKYSDQYVQLSGRLKLATRSAEEFRQIEKELFDVAQNTGTGLDANIEAYARLDQSLDDNAKRQYDLIRVTELLSKTLAISGTSGQNASELIRQFGQAASSDFQAVGQEIGSINDQAPRLAKVLKDAFASSGKSLKQLAEDGELSTKKVLDALLNAGDQIDKEFSQIGDTVGKALTRLDNAFLLFVGQSEAIQKGTSSIAIAINAMADNFKLLAGAITLLAGVMIGRLLPAYAKVLFGFTAARVQAAANAAALNVATAAAAGNARMAIALAKAHQAAAGSIAATTIVVGNTGVAAVAATGSLAVFAKTVGTLGRGLLAAFGGPVGIAITGLFTALVFHTNKADEASSRYNETLSEFKEKAAEMADANGDRARQIKEDTDSIISDHIRELQSLDKLIDAYIKQGALTLGFREGLGKLGIGTAPSEIIEQSDKLREAIKEMQRLQNDAINPPSKKVSFSSGDSGKKKKDEVRDLIDGLRKESELLEKQVQTFNEKEGAQIRARKQLELEIALREKGLKLTAAQNKEVQTYLENIERQTDANERLEKQQKELEENERRRQQALEDYGYAFESAFEDAILSGEKLSDVLRGLAQDVARVALRASIIQPLGTAIGSAFSGSTFLSGILPGFAKGSFNVPSDMIAEIHKGEMIVPAHEAAAIRNGANGGSFNANIVVNTQGGAEGGKEIAVAIEKQLNGWWDQKMRTSLRPGNVLNPVF